MTLDLSMLDRLPEWGAPAVPRRAPPAAFEEDPEQPRFEFDDDDEFAALVEDVKRRGLLQPLVVRRMPSGTLRIRFGALRYRACVRAGLADIPYIETEDERQFDDYAQVAENARRKPLQPLEMARFIERKLAAGDFKKDIAAKLHIDASAVTHYLALANQPPPLLLELYHSRRCRAPYYLYRLRKLMRRDAALVESTLERAAVVDGGAIEEMARQLLQRVMASRESAARGEADMPSASTSVGVAAKTPVLLASTPAVDLTRPQLLGSYRGRGLEVLLHRRPDAAGSLWVRYLDDGEVGQVDIAGVTLSCLRQRDGRGRKTAGTLPGAGPAAPER